MKAIETISGWGGWPHRTCRISVPVDPFHVADALTGASAIARGLGRAYGDSALNPDCTVLTRRLDRLLAFDAESRRAGRRNPEYRRRSRGPAAEGFFLPSCPARNS